MPEKTLEELAEEGRATMRRVNEDRQHGLEDMNRKVADFEGRSGGPDRSFPDPAQEDRIRDIEGAVRQAAKVINALDTLVYAIIRDLRGLMSQQEMITTSGFQMELHMEVLIAALRDKGLITEEEFAAKWQERAVPQIEQLARDYGVKLPERKAAEEPLIKV